jgi:hypothetical protein
MYRAIVLTTLVILLLAVAGVSVAQEGQIFAAGPNSDDPPGATTPERTSLEATGLENTSPGQKPGATPETTVGDPEKPTTVPQGEEEPTAGTNDIGKPEHAGKAPDPGRSRDVVVGQGYSEPEGLREKELPERGSGRQKATLCHNGNKTLTVGAPALAAHLRHGATSGACQGEVSGPEPSGETVGAEAARNGKGGGRAKVVLCHKGKTLTVGAPARAAHLRHGDNLGACR